MLQPTPALISVNFTPWAMARLQPSLGLTTRVLARSDFAPTTMHLLPASRLLSARQARVSRVRTNQEFKVKISCLLVSIGRYQPILPRLITEDK